MSTSLDNNNLLKDLVPVKDAAALKSVNDTNDYTIEELHAMILDPNYKDDHFFEEQED